MTISQIKQNFPIFKSNPDLVYFDNGATTLKPEQVINKLTEYYSTYSSNVHRGLYPIAVKADEEYENARRIVSEFINADFSEIIFTSGTTESINGITSSLARSGIINENDNILITELEHHANIIPWQALKNVHLDYIPVNENFELDFTNIDLNKYYKVVAVTHVSNVTGTVNDIKKIRKLFPKSILVIDCAQSAARLKIDVKDLDVDFMAFSGHKIYGPTGIGVLFGKYEWLKKMEPFKFGGGMISEVNKKSSVWAEVPAKFEAGTPPIAEAIALGEAINFVNEVGLNNIWEHEQKLRTELITELRKLDFVEIYHPDLKTDAAAVVSFNVKGVHPHDVAQFLGDNGICVRAGHHCTHILHRDKLDINASVRVSLGVYNEVGEVERLCSKLTEVHKLF